MQPFDSDWLFTPGDPLKVETPIIPRWEDPRPDLVEDHERWVSVLQQLFVSDKQLWGTFHALRCGGSQLVVENSKLTVRLPTDWELGFKGKVRKKYLMPRVAAIERILSEVEDETHHAGD